MSIKGNLIYAKTSILSQYHRSFIKKQGVDYTVSKFPTIAGRRIMSPEEIHNYIYLKLMSGQPFMIGRFGSIELTTVGKEYLGVSYHKRQGLNELCNNAGFFPCDDEQAFRFSELMIRSMAQCDVQGIWYLAFEDYFLKTKIPKKTVVTEVRYLEPWFVQNSWTKALEGKKVLVIHPFIETISKQYYNNREKLFTNKTYLPDFELKCIKAVQTIAGTRDTRFETWFDALEFMYKQAMDEDFDVAIIGCGAYGYPLAAKLKESGKQVIHMGGVTQALFGIKGKRWDIDKNPIIRDLYNEYWTRPSDTEVPKQKDKVEGGCYW